jgi:rhodanese-related sulfurtransferase
MKHLILGFIFLFLASAAAAQDQTDWRTLQTMSGSDVIAVEGATEIDVSSAKTLHDQGVKFVDVRKTSKWKRGHIPGASGIRYPTEAALMEIVDKTDEVVFYCDCAGYAGCNRSTDASAKAVSWGYKNVYYLTDTDAWDAAGYPLEKAE